MPIAPFELVKREMARKAKDTIRVKNPTNEDFVVYWDSAPWRVKAGDHRDVPRYIALHFAEKLIDHILTRQEDEAVKKENRRRVTRGQAEMDPQKEQPKFEFKYRINNKSLREPLFRQIWGGKVGSYGVDELQVVPSESQQKDTRSLEEQLADEMDDKVPEEEVPESSTVTSVAEE